MEKKEITTLKIIESLERDPRLTQRALARELNISLGFVNFITKRLVLKGYLKLTTLPKKRIRYILTPKGILEKSRLTCKYIIHSIEFYKETRTKIKKIYEQLYEKGKKRIFFIGSGELTEIALMALNESNLKLAGIIDKKTAGKSILGCSVKGYSCLNGICSNDIIIVTKNISDQDFINHVCGKNPPCEILNWSDPQKLHIFTEL